MSICDLFKKSDPRKFPWDKKVDKIIHKMYFDMEEPVSKQNFYYRKAKMINAAFEPMYNMNKYNFIVKQYEIGLRELDGDNDGT